MVCIFDLDGTLANCEHRRHFIDPTQNPKCWDYCKDDWYIRDKNNDCVRDVIYKWKADWKSFYEACDKDKLITPVAEMWNNYEVEIACNRSRLQIWSGRCESVRNKTIDWLKNNLFGTDREFWESILKMRSIGDYTPDNQLKERWLDKELSKGNKIDMVFDGRKKVIDMWIRRGIFVFDTSQGRCDF